MRNFKYLFLTVLLLSSAVSAALGQETEDIPSSCPEGYVVMLDSNQGHTKGTCVSFSQAPVPAPPTIKQQPFENAVQQALIAPSTAAAIVAMPPVFTPIGTGGMVFGKSKLGCYANRSKDGKTQLAPFFEETTSAWIDADKYDVTKTANGVDITMTCKASAEGLTVTLSARGYDTGTFSAKWN